MGYKSRKNKERLRSRIRNILENKAVKHIHFLDDDFWYWVAREAWQELHKGRNYEDYFKTITNFKGRIKRRIKCENNKVWRIKKLINK